MTHLGERLTALVDGELGHDERDRALVHLAACDQCRAEADALRVLKRRLRAMGDALPAESLLSRLQAMGEPGDPLPPEIRRLPGQSRVPALTRPRDTRPVAGRPRSAAAACRRLPRGRYLVAGAATLAVLGIGSAAFAAGSDPRSLPRVAPSVEQFAVEHALTSGDVPLTDPKPAEKTSDSP
ncbi:MAG: putative transrane anti-sigma factor [Actinoallomurus sp.]|jgi:anti-sigma factor RsiW|nr:putative transrane anti-sigma factor [Actinoallomurus sp.]